MLTLIKGPYQFEAGGSVWPFLLKATFYLALLDDVEVLTPVSLVENVLTVSQLLHLQTVDQFKLLELL